MGKASSVQKKLYDLVRRAQEAGKTFAKNGVIARSVDATVRAIIDNAGYKEYFGHGTGHGVGRRIHEAPRLNKTDSTVLKNNMVVTIEPGIYDPRFGGIRIEDTVVIRETNCESLTLSPRILIEAGVQ
jgi:Xaa-Pro aminopeptidase